MRPFPGAGRVLPTIPIGDMRLCLSGSIIFDIHVNTLDMIDITFCFYACSTAHTKVCVRMRLAVVVRGLGTGLGRVLGEAIAVLESLSPRDLREEA